MLFFREAVSYDLIFVFLILHNKTGAKYGSFQMFQFIIVSASLSNGNICVETTLIQCLSL
jgi:hypothetical protein